MSRHDEHCDATQPTQVSSQVDLFDRFALGTTSYPSRAWFFSGCLILVLVRAPSIISVPLDTWQLMITATTIITFLLVAVRQNTQTRADAAVQHRVNVIPDALSGMTAHFAQDNPPPGADLHELRAAVGPEQHEST